VKIKKLGLLPKLVIGLALGIAVGHLSHLANVDFAVRALATFGGIFGNFINYIVPFIIIGFVAPGIAELGEGGGKLLGLTATLAYLFTIIAGVLAFTAGSFLLPLIPGIAAGANAVDPEKALLPGYFTVAIPPIMSVTTALITAFVLGLGIPAVGGKALHKGLNDFKKIVEYVINHVLIPFLPLYIAATFASMTHAGQVAKTMSVFGWVFFIAIILHLFYLFVQYTIASIGYKKSPLALIKTMIPTYITAMGTMSSAATIPVTTRCTKENKVSEEVTGFVVPLCANIHMSGSTITLTICSMAVLGLTGITPHFGSYFGFICMLGITIVAAPGVPGGAVMASLGLLSSILGFGPEQCALMIALYLTQDSFGTATNVTGDGAIAIIVDRIRNRKVEEVITIADTAKAKS
jgi:Na+/H+-dicarboxylate symporter